MAKNDHHDTRYFGWATIVWDFQCYIINRREHVTNEQLIRHHPWRHVSGNISQPSRHKHVWSVFDTDSQTRVDANTEQNPHAVSPNDRLSNRHIETINHLPTTGIVPGTFRLSAHVLHSLRIHHFRNTVHGLVHSGRMRVFI